MLTRLFALNCTRCGIALLRDPKHLGALRLRFTLWPTGATPTAGAQSHPRTRRTGTRSTFGRRNAPGR